ncbi:MAG: 3-oxoacyl-ACP reductase FabG [Lachnospiraceae bacterium]|nr:3-oxoacyl-ACP reductase FabG [Lachnospiraceae bacterium]
MKNEMNRTALVTGASRGIGKAIAERLAKEGYNLALTCSKDADNLNKLAKCLEDEYNIKCIAFVVDGGDCEQVERLFENEFFKENGIDLLVNNAGISYVGLLHEMTPEEWHRVISVNLDSVFYTCRKAIPYMLSRHAGRIVNISSVWGNVGASMEVAYSTTKGGINTFTKALAKELAPSGIAVNAIACGLIDTSMNACFSEEDLAAVVEEIPADRIGKPEEVADMVLRIAEAPDYLTGQIVTIDGGWV